MVVRPCLRKHGRDEADLRMAGGRPGLRAGNGPTTNRRAPGRGEEESDMTSVRIRTCAAGTAVAAAAGVLVDHGAVFGAGFVRSALLGVALGAVLGLVPSGTPSLRLAGFGAGFGAAWAGYLLRAAVLPDIPLGRALAAVLTVSLVTAVATASADRIPLWSGLLGAGALVGAFELTYLQSPPDVVGDSTATATAVLLAVAVGFAATHLLTAGAPRPALDTRPRTEPADALPDAAAAEPARPLSLFEDDPAAVPAPRQTADIPSESSR